MFTTLNECFLSDFGREGRRATSLVGAAASRAVVGGGLSAPDQWSSVVVGGEDACHRLSSWAGRVGPRGERTLLVKYWVRIMGGWRFQLGFE